MHVYTPQDRPSAVVTIDGRQYDAEVRMTYDDGRVQCSWRKGVGDQRIGDFEAEQVEVVD